MNESDYNEILQQAVAVFDKARLLYERIIEGKHGDGVIKRLSADLKQHFPEIGASPRQLWNMKRFYLRYLGCDEKLLRSVAVLPWSHILLLISKKLDNVAVQYYATEAVAKGWTRDLLLVCQRGFWQ